MKIKVLIGALFAAIMLVSGAALAQDSRAAVVINLAGQTCQVCEDDGSGGCNPVARLVDRGIVVDKTSGHINAPQMIKLTCQVSGLANESGKGLLFDAFNTGIRECVVGETDGYTIITDNWRQSLSPKGVGLLSCLFKGSLF